MQPTKKRLPRGLRNNNPLNIRIGNTWLGERANPTDYMFEEFVSLDYGYRAAFCILRRYIRHYHRNTIALIITSWAPPIENCTLKYIDHVALIVGIAPDDIIDYADEETMIKLAAAMTIEECGQPVDEAIIRKGYRMA